MPSLSESKCIQQRLHSNHCTWKKNTWVLIFSYGSNPWLNSLYLQRQVCSGQKDLVLIFLNCIWDGNFNSNCCALLMLGSWIVWVKPMLWSCIQGWLHCRMAISILPALLSTRSDRTRFDQLLPVVICFLSCKFQKEKNIYVSVFFFFLIDEDIISINMM